MRQPTSPSEQRDHERARRRARLARRGVRVNRSA